MLRRASTKIAHNSTIPVLGASQDLKPLQNLIMAEKAVLVSLNKLSVDYFKASDALRTWGLSEGSDLGDILSASSSLLKVFSSALVEYASHGDFMRKQLKVIRTKEEALDNLKRCRRNARRKAKNVDKKLSKMALDSKNLGTQKESLFHLQEEIRKMDAGVMYEETSLNNFKRTATKAWMGLKFGGLVQCCQKGTIAGEFGKLAISKLSEETNRSGVLHRFSLNSDSQVEGLVQEADRYINAVTLTIIPSVRFPNIDEHNRESPNSPTTLVSSSEPQPPPPSASTFHGGNAESNFPAMQPVRRRDFHPPETPISPVNPSSYAPHYPQQPSQGISSSSQTLPSGPQQQLSSTSTPRGRNETNPQSARRRKGQPPETPVSPVNPSAPPYQPPSQGTSSSSQTLPSGSQQQLSSTSTSRGRNETNSQPVRRRKGQPSERPVSPVNPSAPPYQPPSQETSSSQTLPSESEPQQQPSPTSTVRGSLDGNPQATKPVRKRKGHPPEISVPPVNSSSEYPQYVPPYQPQPSQGTVHSPSSHSLLSSQAQQPRVNESAVTRNGSSCAVHRGNTVHRHNTSTSRPPTSSVNTRQPTTPTTSSSSKARYQLQDPPPSSGSSSSRHPTNNNPSSAGTSHLTPNRYNGWSQPSEDATGDALYGDEPPPSFHDALLAPVVGSRSEISLASSVGHFLIRPTRS